MSSAPVPASLRVSFSQREIEISGDLEAVRELLERFDPLFEEFSATPGPTAPRLVLSAGVPDGQNGASHQPPAVFGEYLHEFPAAITDVDRMLIAAYFIQSNSPPEENCFVTSTASDMLKEQGVKLSNPSQAVRQNLDKKTVFALVKGKFRVSKDGLARLQELRATKG